MDPITVQEDMRRLGVILTSAGLLSVLLEDGNLLAASGLALTGLLSLVVGNLRYQP
ncbi:MAG: hypothetical protein OXC05_15275 [Halieaceae bacterium]|nr:hypothetical protein [Halieaceae bacterium]